MFVSAVAFFLTDALLPAPATMAQVHEWKIPEEAKGFLGTLEGEAFLTLAGENTFVLKVKGIVREDKESKAKKSDKLKGENALIFINNNFKDGRITPDERQLKFMKEVKKGDKLEVTVRSDAMARLRMTDVPKIIKK